MKNENKVSNTKTHESSHTSGGFCEAEQFNKKVQNSLKNAASNEYMLISLDIDNFKYVNDLFGYTVGDKVLNAIHKYFSTTYNNILFTHLNDDHFMFFSKYDSEVVINKHFLNLTNIQSCMSELLPSYYNLVFSIGILHIRNTAETIDSLFDKVNCARKFAKGSHDNSYIYYDAHMEEELQRKKEVTVSMQRALKNSEFALFLQPKVMMKTGKLIGVEALARWNSPKYGFLSPDRFIPIFEQNGFIKLLDFYMLEQVCIFLKKQMSDISIVPVPISINFSRVHVNAPDLPQKIFEVVSQYQIPTHLIEIEFTENVLLKDLQKIIDISHKLKDMGFTISIDDFGSEYSSLSCLKDLPVDVVKIDKSFLTDLIDGEKNMLIIERIVELLKSLRLVTVIEGVETEAQADALRKFGCDIAQGFYYAKPMSVPDYEQFIKDNIHMLPSKSDAVPLSGSEGYEAYLDAIPKEFELDNWELYTLAQNIDMGLMKGYLDQDSAIQYINKRALEYIGYTAYELREVLHNIVLGLIHPEDQDFFQSAIQTLIKTGTPTQFKLRAIRKDGEIICLEGRISCVFDINGRPIGIYAFQDITEQLKRNQKALKQSEIRYKVLVEQSEDIFFDWDFESDTMQFSKQYRKLTGFDPIKINDNYENLNERVHHDDVQIYRDWVKATFKKICNTPFEFRFLVSDGGHIWVKTRSTALCNDAGKPIRAIGRFINISSQKDTIDYLKMKSQLDSLTKLYNKAETESKIKQYIALHNFSSQAALLIVDIDNFKGVNDNLGHQFGDMVLQDVAQKMEKLFRDTDILGRIGGDEFAILMCDIKNTNEVQKKAQILLNSIRNIYFGEQTKYEVSISIGIAYYPIHGKYFEDLYNLADNALYESKRRGKNCYTVFHDKLQGSLPAPGTNEKTSFEHDDRFLTSYYEGDLIYSIFEMLYETSDITITLNKILEIVGKRFAVDRVYIFEFSDDGKYANNTYEWCNDDIPSEIDMLQNISTNDLASFFEHYNKEGILPVSDINTLDSYSFELLHAQGVKAVLHCAIYNEGHRRGFIGFDDCHKTRQWKGDEVAILGYISRILSTFVLKKQISKELWNSYQNYTAMLDNLNGYVYVINPATYEILYVNNASKSFNLNVGDKCHEATFGISSPCVNCPAQKLNDMIDFATEEIYSQKISSWVSSAASKLMWTDGRQAALICCTDISKYKTAPPEA